MRGRLLVMLGLACLAYAALDRCSKAAEVARSADTSKATLAELPAPPPVPHSARHLMRTVTLVFELGKPLELPTTSDGVAIAQWSSPSQNGPPPNAMLRTATIQALHIRLQI